MTRRVKKTGPILAPLAENFLTKLSSADDRLRRKVVRFGFVVLALFFGYSFMNGTYGVPRVIKLEFTEDSLRKSNQEMTVRIVDAARIRKLLKFDKDYIESVARSRYYMIYPGEQVYRYRGK